MFRRVHVIGTGAQDHDGAPGLERAPVRGRIHPARQTADDRRSPGRQLGAERRGQVDSLRRRRARTDERDAWRPRRREVATDPQGRRKVRKRQEQRWELGIAPGNPPSSTTSGRGNSPLHPFGQRPASIQHGRIVGPEALGKTGSRIGWDRAKGRAQVLTSWASSTPAPHPVTRRVSPGQRGHLRHPTRPLVYGRAGTPHVAPRLLVSL